MLHRLTGSEITGRSSTRQRYSKCRADQSDAWRCKRGMGVRGCGKGRDRSKRGKRQTHAVSSRKIAPGRSSYSWTAVADASMRLASSRVSKLGADRRPGSSSKLDIRKRLAAVIAHYEAGVVCSSIVHGGGKRLTPERVEASSYRLFICARRTTNSRGHCFWRFKRCPQFLPDH